MASSEKGKSGSDKTKALTSIPALIAKKRDGLPWTDDEIQTLVDAICDKTIENAQIGRYYAKECINNK